MNKFTSEMVDDYADKLLIGLSKDENKMVLDEFEVIDKSMEVISKFPSINDVEPMTHALDNFEFIPRNDEEVLGTDIKLLLQNCQNVEGREIEIPRVV